VGAIPSSLDSVAGHAFELGALIHLAGHRTVARDPIVRGGNWRLTDFVTVVV
jgi:hypothetical protein